MGQMRCKNRPCNDIAARRNIMLERLVCSVVSGWFPKLYAIGLGSNVGYVSWGESPNKADFEGALSSCSNTACDDENVIVVRIIGITFQNQYWMKLTGTLEETYDYFAYEQPRTKQAWAENRWLASTVYCPITHWRTLINGKNLK